MSGFSHTRKRKEFITWKTGKNGCIGCTAVGIVIILRKLAGSFALPIAKFTDMRYNRSNTIRKKVNPMDMRKLIRELFQSIVFEEQRIPQQPAKPPQTRSKPASRSTPAKRNTSPRKTRSSAVTSSQQVYGEQSLADLLRQSFSPVPHRIFEMRARTGYDHRSGQRSLESLFYEQGVFMADFTDDFPENVSCARVMPTYAMLSDRELRAYFTWRTQYRAGRKPAAQSSFLLLYAYELLNLIGVPAAEDAYSALLGIIADYGESFPLIEKQIRRWLPDLAVWYGIPYRCGDQKEAACMTVVRHSGHSAQELLTSLDTFSKYKLGKSKCFLAQPDETAEMLRAVYGALLIHYAEEKHISFSAYLLGGQRRQQHQMFDGAVFFRRQFPRDGAHRISPLCVYHCAGGRWAKETFASEPNADRITALLRTFDSILREEIKYRNKLKPADLPAGDADVIRSTIRKCLAEQAKANAPVITLDAAELEEIRRAAAHTTDMLTVPDTAAEPEIPAAAAVIAPVQTDPPEPDPAENMPQLPLSKAASALLLCLLTGESYQPLLDAGQMLSVLTDEINETLYDKIGDSVIETDADGRPVLIEDYIEDVKGLFET
ncbi:MAG TPA: hypothetical protein DDX71_05175 [Ruminococcus sp.]|nr:hypothetical protein [Ruminococcus sp.]